MKILIQTAGADSAGVDAAVQDAAEVTIDVLQLLLGVVVGVVAAIAIGVLIFGIARAFTRGHATFKVFADAVYKPLQVLLVVVGAWSGFGIMRDRALVQAGGGAQPIWVGYLNHAFMVIVILSSTWLVVGIIDGLKNSIHERIRESSERRAKRVQTQMQILHRVIVVIVWVMGFAGVLLTFPQARTAGASLFASAGVVSVVAGLAAQTTLGNVFAGLQLAFSDSIRVGDIVFYDNSYTTVEEITLTYVVLAVWDGRRIIVPSSILTTQSFENWTRRAPEMVGDVVIDVDWAVPVAAARKQLKLILMSTDLWDGKTGVLQVSDAVAGMVRLRAVLSAQNSPTLTDLKNYVREKLVIWIQHEAPQAIPHNYNWEYAQYDFEETLAATNRRVDEQLDAAIPESFPPRENAHADPRPSGQATQVLSIQESDGLKENLVDADAQKVNAQEGLIALAAGTDPATMREWQPQISDSDAPDATIVMKLGDVEKVVHVVKETSESALFSGSVDSEKRQKNFAGPGDEAYEERRKKLQESDDIAASREQELKRNDKSATSDEGDELARS